MVFWIDKSQLCMNQVNGYGNNAHNIVALQFAASNSKRREFNRWAEDKESPLDG
jgi:hypothetical protein